MTPPADAPAVADALASYVRETAPVLMLRLDADGTVTEANAYARELLGRDMVGRAFRGAFVDFDAEAAGALLAGKDGGERRMNVNTPSGTPQTLRVRAVAADGGHLLLGRHDMPELDGLQREVLSLNRDLANTTRELQKANAELARLNELKNRFLGMAAHDLRKPAGVVLSTSELLLDELEGSLDDENREFLRFLVDAAAEMVRLIADFLDVSVIESGTLRLALAPARPAEVIADALRYVRPAATRKGVELVVEPGRDAPEVVMDAAKIGQVVANLVSNAIEHSPAGGQVWIGCEGGDGEVAFHVRDTGGGIPPDKLDSLFKPFGDAGTRKTGGERSVGLGLTIAKKIVEAHHGAIRAESTPGEGATFRFVLPLAPPQEETET